MTARTLAELCAPVPSAVVRGDPSITVADVACSFDPIAPGIMYFALDEPASERRALAAVEAGAGALVVERWLETDVTQVLVPSVHEAMGPMSAEFFGHPARSLTLVGVTGTNGKTTTTFMLAEAFRAAGIESGLIGTIEQRVGDEVSRSRITTPLAPHLQRILARMVAKGLGAAAIEVSSHGLVERRINGCSFDCAVFTNLSRDHLDAHKTMEDYFAAKARLFTRELSVRAAVNIDDAHGRLLIEMTQMPTVTYGLDPAADVRAERVELTANGSALHVRVGGATLSGRIRLPGALNVSNALATVAAFHALGLPPEAALAGIEHLERVPGRLEAIDAGQDFAVFVDMAHNADGLRDVLHAARQLVSPGGSLICVFGCPGGRAPERRLEMGEVASALADLTIITSDSPQAEDPMAVIAGIEDGARGSGGRYVVVPDRGAAIRLAIDSAGNGDVVLIAGRGDQRFQRFGVRHVRFDDRLVVRKALEDVEPATDEGG